MNRRTLLLLLLPLLVSCATLGSYEEPELTLIDMQPAESGNLEQRFKLRFRLLNPNDVALPVTGVRYKVDVLGETFASGATNSDFTVDGFADAEFEVTVGVSLLRATRVLMKAMNNTGEPFSYRLDARIKTTIPFLGDVRVVREGELAFDGAGFAPLRPPTPRSVSHPNELLDVVACRCGLRDEAFVDRRRQVGRACQQPEIVSVQSRDERVPVVRIEFENHVGRVERTEERDLQVGFVGTADEARLADSFLPFAIADVEAAVDHPDLAVLAQLVGRCDLLEIPLEAVIEAGDLIPGPEIAIELEAADRTDRFRVADAARDEQNDRCRQRKPGQAAQRPRPVSSWLSSTTKPSGSTRTLTMTSIVPDPS